jgi:hypothetical protein
MVFTRYIFKHFQQFHFDVLEGFRAENFDIFYGILGHLVLDVVLLVYFMVFGIFPTVLLCCTKKNLVTLQTTTILDAVKIFDILSFASVELFLLLTSRIKQD